MAEAGFHHAGCLRKHFQKDIVSVSACIPALSCRHPTVNGYFFMAGMDLTASTYLLNLTAFTGTAQGKLHSQFGWNQPYEGTTFGWRIGLQVARLSNI